MKLTIIIHLKEFLYYPEPILYFLLTADNHLLSTQLN